MLDRQVTMQLSCLWQIQLSMFPIIRSLGTKSPPPLEAYSQCKMISVYPARNGSLLRDYFPVLRVDSLLPQDLSTVLQQGSYQQGNRMTLNTSLNVLPTFFWIQPVVLKQKSKWQESQPCQLPATCRTGKSGEADLLTLVKKKLKSWEWGDGKKASPLKHAVEIEGERNCSIFHLTSVLIGKDFTEF